MSAEQFEVYQLFKGRAATASDAAEKDTTNRDLWKYEKDGAKTNWHDMSLSDIEWGSSVPKDPSRAAEGTYKEFIKKLKAAGSFGDQQTPFSELSEDTANARDVAKILVDKDNAFMQDFSRWLVKSDGGNLTKLNSPGQMSAQLDEGSESTEDDAVKITLKEQGYYLIADKGSNPGTGKGGAISEYLLAVLGTQDIYLKADAPELTKAIVKAGSDTLEDSKAAIAEADEDITFRLTGTLPKNFANYKSYKYIFHDVLPKGLTFGTSGGNHSANVKVTVTRKGQPGETYTIAAEEYGVKQDDGSTYSKDLTPNGETPSAETKIAFVFSDLRKAGGLKYTHKDGTPNGDQEGTKLTLQAGDAITVEYSANLNEKAEAGASERKNENKATLEYSNNPNADGDGTTDSTPEGPGGKANVYTFGLDLKKAGDDPGHAGGLKDACFILVKGSTDGGFMENGKLKTGGLTGLSAAKFSGSESGDSRGIASWEKMDAKAQETDFGKLYEAYTTALANYEAGDDDGRAHGLKTSLDTAITALYPFILKSKEPGGSIPKVSGGLDASEDGVTYWLAEIIAPEGYDAMDPVKVTVKAKAKDDGSMDTFAYAILDGNSDDAAAKAGNDVSVKLSASGSAEAGKEAIYESGLISHTLKNHKAPILPHTGGIGAMAVYGASALVLAIGAALLIMGRKRRKG